MNRICFVSKKEKAQHLGLNTGYVRECLTLQEKVFQLEFRAFFLNPFHHFFVTNMHLLCWNMISVYWVFSLDNLPWLIEAMWRRQSWNATVS